MRTTRALIVASAFGLACTYSALASQAPAAQKQPEFTALKADFIPGEKTIFYDDFTDMNPGDAPARFKVRGAAPELMASGDLRQLQYTKDGSLFPNLTALPANFTYESEVKIEAPRGINRMVLVLLSKGKTAADWMIGVRANSADTYLARRLPKYEELGRTPLKLDLSQPVKLALWVQDGRVRMFVNGDKQMDVNQVELPPIDGIEIRTSITGVGNSIAYRTIRFAESAPDVSDTLSTSGRLVTHGILFDTNSDRLQPASAAVLQAVAKSLTASPAMKVLIEGHTDGSGDAARNMDLSKRRAEAVKSVLVTQFKIEAARLSTAGLGATKPIDSNDTPQGRAQNRRVEFAKQ